MNRRQALHLIAAAAVSPSLPGTPALAEPWALHPGPSQPGAPGPDSRTRVPTSPRLSAQEDSFLDDLERRACLYFSEQASPVNGQVLDRAAWIDDSGKLDPRTMASIAATGFGLTALCIADQRGYLTRALVADQVRRTLRFHANVLPNEHGFFFHFNDIATGQRFRNCELSSIDTALLLCGVLTARAHFPHDAEIVDLATKIYTRVDWPWMLNGGDTFSMGWKPDLEKGQPGFLASRWNHYSELMMLYLLALGSPTHPIPPACWSAWSRPRMSFDGFHYISASDPLFVHQYSHAWFDFRYKRDAFADYFANSITATRAHEAFCLDLGQPYSRDYWGISASDSQHGYTAWGGPGSRIPNPTPADLARGFGGIDGSVVPNAAAGSLPFLPTDCLHTLHALKQQHGSRAWGRYGFCDAFHPAADWYDPDVLGIDLGISVLMAENLRSGFAWQTFARNPEVAIAFQKAGFHHL
jgi:hypothetical protein